MEPVFDLVTTVQPAIDKITELITVTSVVSLIAAGLGISVAFFLTWFGVRKLISVIQAAFKSGKLKA